MRKKKDILTEVNTPRGWSRYILGVILLTCVTSDFTSIHVISSTIYNESVLISLLVSAVSALCLDASVAYAALLLNRCTTTASPAARQRCRVLVGMMIAAFGLSYAGLILLAVASCMKFGTDFVQSGMTTRLLLPLCTSVVSFAMSLVLDPNETRLHQLQGHLAALDRELDETSTSAQRLLDVFRLYDPQKDDYEAFRLAVLRLKAQGLAAEHQANLMLARELDKAEITKELLQDDAVETLRSLVEELGMELDIAPQADCHAGAIPSPDAGRDPGTLPNQDPAQQSEKASSKRDIPSNSDTAAA